MIELDQELELKILAFCGCHALSFCFFATFRIFALLLGSLLILLGRFGFLIIWCLRWHPVFFVVKLGLLRHTSFAQYLRKGNFIIELKRASLALYPAAVDASDSLRVGLC